MTPETRLKNKVSALLKKLKAEGVQIKYTKISDRYTEGIPDFLLCVKGRFVAMELKVKPYTPSKPQLRFIATTVEAGGLGAVCYNLEDVIALLEKAGVNGNK